MQDILKWKVFVANPLLKYQELIDWFLNENVVPMLFFSALYFLHHLAPRAIVTRRIIAYFRLETLGGSIDICHM